jgi:beta-lactamase regulating signal transducer with metallopeptidase domain
MSADLVLTLVRLIAVLSAAIVIVLALRIPIRRVFGARIAYALWLLVLMATAAALLPARLVVIEPPAIVAVQTAPVADANETSAVQVSTAAPADEILPPRDKLMPLLLALWALGFAGSFALLVKAQHRFNTRLRTARREGGVHIASQRDIGPAVVGVIMPRIVVPADFTTRYTAQERDLVLAHERAHISAGDVHVNAIAALIQCVFWFNPLVYIARDALRVDQELACDERVMAKHAGARRAYAEAMLKTQRSAAPGRRWARGP